MEVESNSSGSSPPSASDSSASSSSSSSASAAPSANSITWVSPSSLGKRWSSDLWATDLFVVSRHEIQGKHKIRCTACAQLKSKRHEDWFSGDKSLDGTSTPAHHARTCHFDLPKVATWLSRGDAMKAAALQDKKSENQKVTNVKSPLCVFCLLFVIFVLSTACFCFLFLFVVLSMILITLLFVLSVSRK